MATIHDPTALTTTATQYAISTYYDKLWLERLVPDLRWYQGCEKKRLPKNQGYSVKFSSFKKLSLGSALTESTKPTPAVLSTFNVTATLRQYGGYAAVSDFLEMTAITPIVQEAVSVLSEQSALTLDTYLRNVCFGGGFPSATSRISAAARSRYTGSVSAISALQGKVYGHTLKLVKSLSSGVTKSLSGMGALNASAWSGYIPTLRDIRSVVADLRGRDVKPYKDGYYLGIAHPGALADIMSDTGTTGWADWQKYTTPESMYKGEIGRAEGVRFLSTTNALDRGANTGSNVSASFITIIGRGAFGCVDFDSVQDVQNSRNEGSIIVKRANQYNTDDPLNQVAGTVGWKFTIAAAVLNTSCAISLMGLRAA